jgi:predicted O-methyltransferase YrrM
MDEQHFKDIEVVMLEIEQAQWRAERTAKNLRKAGAEDHLVEAVESAQQELVQAHRRLMQGTLFAVPSAQTAL